MVKHIGDKIGGLRNLIFLCTVVGLAVVLLLDIYVISGRLLEPLGYFYIFFSIAFILYIIYPLYTGRRLTRYYWDRTKKHRLSVFGLAFIAFFLYRQTRRTEPAGR